MSDHQNWEAQPSFQTYSIDQKYLNSIFEKRLEKLGQDMARLSFDDLIWMFHTEPPELHCEEK